MMSQRSMPGNPLPAPRRAFTERTTDRAPLHQKTTKIENRPSELAKDALIPNDINSLRAKFHYLIEQWNFETEQRIFSLAASRNSVDMAEINEKSANRSAYATTDGRFGLARAGLIIGEPDSPDPGEYTGGKRKFQPYAGRLSLR